MGRPPALPPASAPQKQLGQLPRVAIEPLPSPWLRHEQFPAVKAAASAPDGLVMSKKSAVAKVGQELKRARTHVDQQLAQLEKQLVAISNYLDGSSSSMFPAHILVEVAGVVETSAAATGGEAAAAQSGAALTDDKLVVAPTANALQSAAFLVEDDLASDSPCTAKGLWRYLDAYSYFKSITPDDMEGALALEDESLAFGDDTLDLGDAEGFSATSVPARADCSPGDKLVAFNDGRKCLPDSSAALTREQDDFLKERLVGALLPVPDHSSPAKIKRESGEAIPNHNPDEGAVELHDKQPKDHQARRREQDEATYVASWDPSRITGVLREVGLVELSAEGVTRCMKNPEDDPVAQEIRLLQDELRATIRETNTAKRVIRQMLDKEKPWLSRQEAISQGNVAKYRELLSRKKELERKRKLKEKKRMRRDVLRTDIASSFAH